MCCSLSGFSGLPELSGVLAWVVSCPCSYLKPVLGWMAKVDLHTAVIWELSWDCQPEHLHVASLCDLAFPQCGSWLQRRLTLEKIFQETQVETLRLLMP